VAEVTVERDNIRVDRLVLAVDCCQAVNPNGPRSQLEGGVLFSLELRFRIPIPNFAHKSFWIRDLPCRQLSFRCPEVSKHKDMNSFQTPTGFIVPDPPFGM